MNDLVAHIRTTELAFLVDNPVSPSRAAVGRPLTGTIVSPQANGLGMFLQGFPTSPDDPILTGKGGGSYKIYDQVLDNPQAFSCFQQRRRAVVSRPWEVEAGADDALSKAAADHAREMITGLDWDGITDRMLFGLWYGFAVGECMYEPRDGKWALVDVVVPNRDRFRFDAMGTLQLADIGTYGQALPDRKFWSYRAGASHDHAFYGMGLAHWCFWPAWFAKNGLNFWSIYLEKFAMPTAIGKVPGGGGPQDAQFQQDKGTMIEALSAIIGQAAIAVPDTFEVELLEATRAGAAEYGKFLDRQDGDIAKIILSQTMTTDNGSSRSQSDTHMEVREEVTAGDADLLCSSFNEGPLRWLTDWNFPGAVPPRLYRIMDDPEDIDTIADRDTKIMGLGWVRTEEKFREVYGDGYERKAEPEPMVVPPGAAPANPAFADAPHVIDRLIASASGPVNAAVLAMAEPLRARLVGLTTPEQVRLAVIEAFADMDEGPLAELIAKTGLGLRAAEDAGLDTERLG